jgi:hypothetical protein
MDRVTSRKAALITCLNLVLFSPYWVLQRNMPQPSILASRSCLTAVSELTGE